MEVHKRKTTSARTAVHPQFLMLGFIFGYPNCCIRNFQRRVDVMQAGGEREDASFQDEDGNEVGYILCQECASLPREEIAARVNKNRHPRLPPFPDSADSIYALLETAPYLD